jgi:hypothetical protein
MTASELTVVAAGQLDAGQLGGLRQVYEQAFPPELRIPLAELAAPGPRDRLLVALDGTDPVGFAAMRLLAGADWVFLRYFAVAASRRRSGLGLRFWHQLRQSVTLGGWPGRIAFEAEDPADAAGDPAEQDIRHGRIRFWERCGASVLPVPSYVMPALTGTGRDEPMVLMAFDPGGGSPDAAEVSSLVAEIFTGHYGLGRQHPLTCAALDSIGSGRG